MKILGIDFSAMFRRNYEASGGKDAGIAHDRSLQTVAGIRDGYDRVAILCDSGPSFRKALLPSYKADRERPPAPFYEQAKRCLGRLAKEGCSVFYAPVVWQAEVAGKATDFFAEADDLCMALAEWCATEGHALDLYGGDKDILQCVSDLCCVRAIRPDHEGAWDEARVVAKMGVAPSMVADLLALGGDASDGFQMFPKWTSDDGGMHPGIGPGTAAKLIYKFGSILDVIANIETKDASGEENIKGAVKEALRRGKPTPTEAAELGLRLATIGGEGLMVDFDVLSAEPVYAPLTERKTTALPGTPAAEPRDREAQLPPEPAMVERHASPPPPPAEPPEVIGEAVAPVRASKTEVSTALARVDATTGIDRFAFQPRTAPELLQMAAWLFESRLYGQYPNEYAILAVMLEANERGVPIGLALRNAYVVKGKTAWSAQFIGALILASGKAEVFEIVESTAERAVLAYQRKGRPEREFVFTIAEAQAAGWLRSGEKGDSKWLTNPRTMLRWAAIREAARAFFFDVVAGMHTPDEIGGSASDEYYEAA